MRFHVVALPHTLATAAFSACAYTAKVRNFARMMTERGHHVVLYGAGDGTDAPCAEFVSCLPEAERAAVEAAAGHYTSAPWFGQHFDAFNAAVAAAIRARAEPQDFVCVIGGIAQKPIADALPHLTTVEFGVGYGGIFAKYRVFESYAWMHTVYGARSGGDAHSVDGQFFDTVIPGYLDPAEFPYRGKHRRGNDYFLFVGRLIDRKGWRTAQQVAEQLGVRFVAAGPGHFDGYGEYAGVVGPEERGRLMAGATAVFVPTQYIEPFGNVAIEAMACGTPVITTDFGAFTETVIDGVTGFRCHTYGEFLRAAQKVGSLDHKVIRRHVIRSYSLDVVGLRYQRYFERLLTLWGDGWYEGRVDRDLAKNVALCDEL